MKDKYNSGYSDIKYNSEYKSVNSIIKELSNNNSDNTDLYSNSLSISDVTQTMDFSQVPEALLEDFVEQGSHVVIYGESNSGKTFLTLDMVAHIATGKSWAGFEYKGPKGGVGVLYLCAEAGKKFKIREAVVKRKLDVDLHAQLEDWKFFRIDNKVIQIDKNGEVRNGVVDIINHYKENHKIEIGVVVIDTLARSFVGDENNTEIMNTYIKEIDEIKTQTDATIILVHHTGKDKTKGARGSSALRAAVDTEIEVINENGDRTMRVTKQRDFEIPEPINFRVVGDNYKIHDNQMFDWNYPEGVLYKSAIVEISDKTIEIVEEANNVTEEPEGSVQLISESTQIINDTMEIIKGVPTTIIENNVETPYVEENQSIDKIDGGIKIPQEETNIKDIEQYFNDNFEKFIESFSENYEKLNHTTNKDLVIKFLENCNYDKDGESIAEILVHKFKKKIKTTMSDRNFNFSQKRIGDVKARFYNLK